MISRFRTILNNLKTIIDNNNYTLDQVKDLTKAQIASLLSLAPNASYWSGGNIGIFTGIKSHIIKHIKRKNDKVIALSIKNKLDQNEKQWLIDNLDRYLEHIES